MAASRPEFLAPRRLGFWPRNFTSRMLFVALGVGVVVGVVAGLSGGVLRGVG